MCQRRFWAAVWIAARTLGCERVAKFQLLKEFVRTSNSVRVNKNDIRVGDDHLRTHQYKNLAKRQWGYTTARSKDAPANKSVIDEFVSASACVRVVKILPLAYRCLCLLCVRVHCPVASDLCNNAIHRCVWRRKCRTCGNITMSRRISQHPRVNHANRVMASY